MGFRLQAKAACVQSECGAVARHVRSVRTAETERAEERSSRPSAPVSTSSVGRPSRSGRGLLAAHARRGGQATSRTGAAASKMERAEGDTSSSCLPAARAVPSARSRELASDGMGSSSSSAACRPSAAQAGPRTRTAWAADKASSSARAVAEARTDARRSSDASSPVAACRLGREARRARSVPANEWAASCITARARGCRRRWARRERRVASSPTGTSTLPPGAQKSAISPTSYARIGRPKKAASCAAMQ
mmetsp:Transcript_32816/g.105188  ORF Transcript_32816/g.105188 Transcript_32816/m.105188 type:complete len:250 (-) Transcript_32816:875-1624(-)